MRRHVLVWVMVGLLASLTACGGEAADTAPTTTIATTTTEVDPTVTTTIAATTTTQATTTTGATTTIEKDLGYATWGERTLMLDVHAPAESEGASVVIFVPGLGGLGAGPFVEDLAEKGSIVFVLHQYAGYGDPTSTALRDGGADVRGAAESVGCAIHFARARATELGSDDPTVVLMGFSLGGGPAAHAALFGADVEARWDAYGAEGGPPRQVDCEATDGSTDVDVLVGIAGAYDVFVPIYEGAYGRSYQQEHDPELGSFLSNVIGVNPDLTVRLIHSTTDNTIPYENSVGFEEALTDAGYDAQLVTWDGGHFVPSELAVETITEVLQR